MKVKATCFAALYGFMLGGHAIAGPASPCETCSSQPAAERMITKIRTPVEAVIKTLRGQGKPQPQTPNTLSPFISDGCSSFPDGNLTDKRKWRNCCIEHDIAYWQGGTRSQRLAADTQLRDCVAATGEHEIAQAMFAGVRVGGKPNLPTRWRWGYGWKKDNGYGPLTPSQRKQVEQLIKKIPSNLDEIPIVTPTFIKK